jgi:cytochrome c556
MSGFVRHSSGGGIVIKLRVGAYVGAILVVGSTVFAVAQSKVSTPEEFDKAMKPAGRAMGASNKALKSGAFADVRKELPALKAALVDTQSFWVMHKKDDAVKMNKESIAKLEAFEKIVATDPVDPAAAGAALREVGQTCSACHKQYRDQDAEGNYTLKAGTIG